MTFDPGQMLRPSEAARVVGLSPQRIRQMADAGQLPCVRSPWGRLVPAEAAIALAEKRRQAQDAVKS